jgi:hypothetical protein
MAAVSLLPGEEGSTSEATLRARQGSYSPLVKKTLLAFKCQPPYLAFGAVTLGPFATVFPNWPVPEQNQHEVPLRL